MNEHIVSTTSHYGCLLQIFGCLLAVDMAEYLGRRISSWSRQP